ncbi:MAG: DNA adenine methylase [Anaerotruncus sp.]|nr:DNA adenine methylase [Anaerotruncus sp.]
MSWIGGKKALRDEVVRRFPLSYAKYIEVFGGAGWVLFHKPPGREEEYFNDFNPNLTNLYLCVQNAQKELELKQQLMRALNSELAFRHLMQANKIPVTDIPNVQRAAEFYQLIRYSFGSACDSFGGQPVNIQGSLPLMDAVSKRLQSVVIFNRDFESLIRLRDGPDSFFYCDPPYFGTEDYYQNVSFTHVDHERLAGVLLGMKGKFLLSYNDCAEIRSLYRRPEIQIEQVERLNNLRQQLEGGCMYAELLIANYDMRERQRCLPEQLTFTV